MKYWSTILCTLLAHRTEPPWLYAFGDSLSRGVTWPWKGMMATPVPYGWFLVIIFHPFHKDFGCSVSSTCRINFIVFFYGKTGLHALLKVSESHSTDRRTCHRCLVDVVTTKPKSRVAVPEVFFDIISLLNGTENVTHPGQIKIILLGEHGLRITLNLWDLLVILDVKIDQQQALKRWFDSRKMQKKSKQDITLSCLPTKHRWQAILPTSLHIAPSWRSDLPQTEQNVPCHHSTVWLVWPRRLRGHIFWNLVQLTHDSCPNNMHIMEFR